MKDEDWFGIAGLWRSNPVVGEAFTMLTTEPGADVAPYHNRQIVVLPPSAFESWLDPAVSAKEVLKPLPAGRWSVIERVLHAYVFVGRYRGAFMC
jgi:putative SOS response-associated peptidase YedK